MKKLVGAGIAGVAIMVAAILTYVLLVPREAIYQGKTVSQWIVELPAGQQLNALGFVDPTTPTPAKKGLRSIGTNAIRYLARAMMNQQDETFLTDFKLKLWFRSSFLQSHFPRPVYPLEIRRAAARVLTEIIQDPETVPAEEVI